MSNQSHENLIHDVSFFNIDNQKSRITFKENMDVSFTIIQNNNRESTMSYKKALNQAENELYEYHQLEVLNNKKISLFFNIIKDEHLLKQMSYVKRVKKNSENRIFVLICERNVIENKNQINQQLSQLNLVESEDYKLLNDVAYIPKVSPATKSICETWSKSYWPLIWKGNDKENRLKQIYLNDFQLPYLSKFDELFELINAFQTNPKDKSIVTLFYNFKNKKVYMFQDTTNSSKFPIAHSIINGIDKICALKESDVNEYLLQDYYVISTHEPCQMCCMALIHSRIKLFLFDKKMSTGALTNNDFCLADFNKLNWKYQVLHYSFSK